VKPPGAEGFLALDRLQERQNLFPLGILQTVHNSKNMVEWKGLVASTVVLQPVHYFYYKILMSVS